VHAADPSGEFFAAVDLGSNSFQLLIAKYSHGQFLIVDRLREMVRLAAGLDSRQCLDQASQDRALACLARFGERLRDISPTRLRAVGTNTLRKAKNPRAFISKAQRLLGHEIDVISGIEEARLIYIGVSRTLPAIPGEQLFVDIGGGSTELAAGKAFLPHTLESLYMGCVSMSRTFFPDGVISPAAIARARKAARLELRPVEQRFRGKVWDRVAGASGTIRAAATVLAALGGEQQTITADGLERLLEMMSTAPNVNKLVLPGLAEERAPVFPGGIAILAEVMRALDIREMTVAPGALRDGILYDLLGRATDEDSREITVRALEARYHVDRDQADRVERTVLMFFDQVAASWKLRKPALRQLLAWAARLHEIGLDIAHSHYHRHGAYLLEHSEMPGFNQNEQHFLACLVGAHRRKFIPAEISAVAPKGWARRAKRMAILLRLAALFNRSRTNDLPDILEIKAQRRSMTISLTDSWLEANPLTLADIEVEQKYLQVAGIELKLVRMGADRR
jgi:exopolyphosphatase/guanosine-5'-triphosphate,3'-diphosphate pyrophosphatase